MSTITLDPVDRLLDAQSAASFIRDREPLRFDYVPQTINHRDQEQKEVAQRLLPILKHAKPSNLLVYGGPGTGKTLVVRKVLSKIQERAARSNLAIQLVYSNAKHQTTLYGLLAHLGHELGMDTKQIPMTGLSISEIFRRITSRIHEGSLNTVFVIDEMDHLARLASKSNNDVLYQMTRADEQLGAGSLTLVGISNNLAFKNSLDPRVLSTLGEEEIVFTNYTTEQLRMILEERASGAFADRGAIDEEALSLCAAMAGREHGDARRAIDTLRVAAEIAERLDAPRVAASHVREAAAKMDERKEKAALRSYPLHEKLLVIAVMRAQGPSTGEVCAAYRDLCERTGQAHLTQRRATQMLSEVEMSGIISGRISHQGMHGRTKKFKLMVAPEIVREAFAGDLVLKNLF